MRTIISTLFGAAFILLASNPGLASEQDLANQVRGKKLFMTPLEWSGATTPTEKNSAKLLGAIQSFEEDGVKSGFAALERYLKVHPDSEWANSLHLNMAAHYRKTGEYSLALEHWQKSWNLAKAKTDEKSKLMAEQTLAGWTRLLGSLGQKEKLDALFEEGAKLGLNNGKNASYLNATKEGLAVMKSKPEISYRCGSYALTHLMLQLNKTNLFLKSVSETASPENGFSLSDLIELAGTNGLKAVSVRRPAGAQIPVPSVVHWKLNHYAAILEKKDSAYLVADPTFGRKKWIEEDVINTESSGYFLLASASAPTSWERLSMEEASSIKGKGYPNEMDDGDDDPGDDDDCPPPPPPETGDGAGAGEGEECPKEEDSTEGEESAEGDESAEDGGPGMAYWKISEPYISLWLHDTPLFYRMSDGEKMKLSVAYHHRAIAKGVNIAGFGDRWECNWLESIEKDASNATDFVISKARGSKSVITVGTPEYKTGDQITYLTNRIVLDSNRGKKKEYGFSETFLSGAVRYYLTNRVDAYGRSTKYNYEVHTNIDTTTVVRLKSVVDRDGRTSFLYYANTSFSQLITSVTNAYNQSASFLYDSTGRLTNITDSINLQSSFKYNSSGIITNLHTGYGDTAFAFFAGTNTLCALNRAIEVTEATGAKQAYAYHDISPSSMYYTYYAGDGYPLYRNSFHWNRAQYQALSTTAKTNLIEILDEDYNKASLKHWFHGEWLGDHGTVVKTLSTVAGAVDPVEGYRAGVVYYNYYGQGLPEYIGTLRFVTGIHVPYGADHTIIERNSVGRPTRFTYQRSGGYANYTNEFDVSGTILLKVWGPNGEQTRGYGYHPTIPYLLTSVTNAMTNVTRFTHDLDIRVTSITSPAGLVTTNEYYTSGPNIGFLKTRTEVGFTTNSFDYINGNLAVKTNTLGLVTTYTYDDLNRLTSVGYPGGITTSNVYTLLDRTGIKDRTNNWTRLGFNSLRQLVAQTNVNGLITTFDYCDCGSPNQIVRKDGTTSLTNTFSYDLAGRIILRTLPDGYAQTNFYDNVANRVKRIDDSSGRSIHYAYADYGQVSYVGVSELPSTSPTDTLLERYFDSYNRVQKTIDRNGVTITNDYDVLDRLIIRATGDVYGNISGVETFSHSERGRIRYVDALGNTNHYSYDAKGRLQYETNANNEILQYTYNPVDDISSLTDGKSQTTLWSYDVYGRVVTKTNAASLVVFTNAYDTMHRLAVRWTPAKGLTTYGYDVMGNLTNVDYPGAVMDIVYGYDLFGRMTNMTDAVGATRFGYNPGSQLTSEDGPWANDTVTYGYNNRHRSQMSLSQPNASAWSQTYGYDGYWRLNNTTSPAGSFDNYYSGGVDRVEYTYYPSSWYMYNYNQYDSFSRLIGTAIWAGGLGSLNSHAYSYNAGNQRTQQVFTVDNSGNYNFSDYSYDKIGQLKTAKGTDYAYDYGISDYVSKPRLNEQLGYSYDQAWNLQQRTNNALVQTFGSNNRNELTNATRSGTLTVAGTAGIRKSLYSGDYGVTGVAVTGGGLTSAAADIYADGEWARTNATLSNGDNIFTAVGTDSYSRTSTDKITNYLPATVTYLYDSNGNLTNDGLRVLEYDYENQLTNVYVSLQWRSDSQYDGLGRRRIRKDYTWGGSAWIKTNEVRYVYDKRLVVQERDANNTPQVTYTRGLDLSSSLQGAGGIGGLLARTDNSKLIAQSSEKAHAFYHSDGNGNVTMLMDINGAILARYHYDPYGNILAMSGPLAEANTLRFSSKEYHQKSGLYYYLYRFYDPNLQRWVNADPIGENGGLNLYTFCYNNQLWFLDVFGLCGEEPPPSWPPAQEDQFPKKPVEGKDALNKFRDPLLDELSNIPPVKEVKDAVKERIKGLREDYPKTTGVVGVAGLGGKYALGKKVKVGKTFDLGNDWKLSGELWAQKGKDGKPEGGCNFQFNKKF